tara:strand:- start:328 stop:498 length:171 start_codon:yes stop_codon:yes gene_type:complete
MALFPAVMWPNTIPGDHLVELARLLSYVDNNITDRPHFKVLAGTVVDLRGLSMVAR